MMSGAETQRTSIFHGFSTLPRSEFMHAQMLAGGVVVEQPAFAVIKVSHVVVPGPTEPQASEVQFHGPNPMQHCSFRFSGDASKEVLLAMSTPFSPLSKVAVVSDVLYQALPFPVDPCVITKLKDLQLSRVFAFAIACSRVTHSWEVIS